MALEVSKKKTLRTSSKRSFTRTKNNLMKSIEDDEGLDLVQDWYEELKVAWTAVQNSHTEFVSVLSSVQAEQEEVWLDECDAVFSEAKRAVHKYLKPKAEMAKREVSSGLKLSRVELPRFSGRLRDYPRFKSDFKTQVLPNISKDSAAYTLRTCLSKRAQDVVRVIDDDLEEMWLRLDEEYGDPSQMVDLIMNEIKRFRLPNNDKKKLLEFIDVIEMGYHDLKYLDMEKEMSNAGTVSIIEGKLPEVIREKWAERVSKDGSEVDKKDKFPHLLKFLLEVKRTTKYMTADIRDQSRSSEPKVHHVAANQRKEQTSRQSERHEQASRPAMCLLHGAGEHSTADCGDFKAMSMDQKNRLMKEKGACWSCLKRGHRIADCMRRKRCGVEECDKFHHHLLHVKPAQVLTNAENDSPCLLQIMKVRTGRRGCANVLWDSGSTISLITDQKAKELGLKGTPCTLAIVGVGCVREEVQTLKYSLKLLDEEGEEVEFQVYGMKKISSPISPVDTSHVRLKAEEHQYLDVSRPQGEVEVLIGMDYAGFHPVRIQSVDHLLIMQNRFGVCLGGSHPELREYTDRLSPCGPEYAVMLLTASTHMVNVDEFFTIEAMGIECTPRCGGCKCGKCPTGSKNYTLKDEKELKLIEGGLTHKEDHWEAQYPWIKDPRSLPDNKLAAQAVLKSTERRLKKDPEYATVYQAQIQDMVNRGAASCSFTILNSFD